MRDVGYEIFGLGDDIRICRAFVGGVCPRLLFYLFEQIRRVGNSAACGNVTLTDLRFICENLCSSVAKNLVAVSLPTLNQLSRLCRIVRHANPPGHFLRTYNADIIDRQSLRAPQGRRINGFASMIPGRFLRHVLRIFVRTGRRFEARP
jgi:hypothetical protein